MRYSVVHTCVHVQRTERTAGDIYGVTFVQGTVVAIYVYTYIYIYVCVLGFSFFCYCFEFRKGCLDLTGLELVKKGCGP